MKTATPDYLRQLRQVLAQSAQPALRELANEIGAGEAQ